MSPQVSWPWLSQCFLVFHDLDSLGEYWSVLSLSLDLSGVFFMTRVGQWLWGKNTKEMRCLSPSVMSEPPGQVILTWSFGLVGLPRCATITYYFHYFPPFYSLFFGSQSLYTAHTQLTYILEGLSCLLIDTRLSTGQGQRQISGWVHGSWNPCSHRGGNEKCLASISKLQSQGTLSQLCRDVRVCMDVAIDHLKSCPSRPSGLGLGFMSFPLHVNLEKILAVDGTWGSSVYSLNYIIHI